MHQQSPNMTTAVNEEEIPQLDAQHCRPVLLQSTTDQEEQILRNALHTPVLAHVLQGVNHQLESSATDAIVRIPPLQKSVQHLDDLQGSFHALNLAEQDVQEKVDRCNEKNEKNLLHTSMRPHDVRLHSTDTKYPEALSTEESPRRRARSLPWNSIPEVEEEEDSLMCCCKLKKKVKFADSLGLTLANVKHFLPSDEPFVPKAVLARLQSYPPTVCIQRSALNEQEEMYGGEMVPPSITPVELLTKLDEQGVCLEQVSSSTWGVRGCVLVRDPEEKAQVKIRYTFNEWLSFLDCCAIAADERVAPFPSPGCRRFIFNLNYPPSTPRIHFAICFNTGNGQELWDNNKGVNYTVSFQQELTPETQTSSPEQEEWGGSQLW